MNTLLRCIVTTLILLPVCLPGIADELNQAPASARRAKLQRILDQNCTVCHGPKLKGKIGPALTAKALGPKDERMLVATIMGGREGTVMPSWEFMLKEDEARWLVKFLRNGEM